VAPNGQDPLLNATHFACPGSCPIREALAETEGDIEAAATRLGCGKSTLYRRISQLGIES
jgi:transcriptional regulator of acetoin/glycerol metabolism